MLFSKPTRVGQPFHRSWTTETHYRGSAGRCLDLTRHGRRHPIPSPILALGTLGIQEVVGWCGTIHGHVTECLFPIWEDLTGALHPYWEESFRLEPRCPCFFPTCMWIRCPAHRPEFSGVVLKDAALAPIWLSSALLVSTSSTHPESLPANSRFISLSHPLHLCCDGFPYFRPLHPFHLSLL